MKRCLGNLSLACLLALSLLSAVAYGQDNRAGKCTGSLDDYEGYTVREVRIDSPLGWLFGSVDQRLKQIVSDPSLAIKKDGAFHKTAFNDSFIQVKNNFPELQVSSLNRVAVRVARPSIENCDDKAKKLDVVYRVYTLGIPYYLIRAFEHRGTEGANRSVADTPATQRLANYFPQPYLGYNRTRRGFGGTKLSINQPGDLLDKISLDVSGSSTSAEVRAEASGSKDSDSGPLRHSEWRLGYLYADVPSKTVKLKEGAAVGQFFTATRAFGSQELILRFGASIEGGNKQSGADSNQVLPDGLISTGYASGKTFIGATMRTGGNLFGNRPLEILLKGSYGLQVGNVGEGQSIDYLKHIFDTAASLRYLPRDHRPISLETQFTAGTIQTFGQLPVAERFFGGNAEQNFIAGDNWAIRGNPFIRSFPEKHLSQINQTGVIGGDSFFSANLTLAATVAAKPLVPEQVLEDPDFPGLVNFELNSSESILRNNYLSQSPEFRAIAEQTKPMAELLKLIQKELGDLEKAVQRELGDRDPGPAIIDQIATCNDDLETVRDDVAQILEDLQKNALKTGTIRELVVGFPTKKPPIPGDAAQLTESIQDLIDLPDVPTAGDVGGGIKTLVALREKLEGQRKKMADDFIALDDAQSKAAKDAANKARRDMVYPRRVLSQLLHEANLVAVSPVLFFDAARISQRGLGSGQVRYGLGGGVRFSIVSFDVTAGYSWNLHRQPWEDRGALVFTMALSNLFR